MARFSQIRGWGSGTHPAAILVTFLEKLVDPHAFSDVVSREGSFTFLVHECFVDTLLCASGSDAIFLKVHEDEGREKMELLWIDEEIGLADALLSAQDPTVFGLAEKGKKGRLALRFKTVEDMEKFAKANGVSDQVLLPRWKVSGIPVASGLAGLSSLLQKLGWQVDQIIIMMMITRFLHPQTKAKMPRLIFGQMDNLGAFSSRLSILLVVHWRRKISQNFR